MACNNRKDLTKCVAKTRIRVFESRYFFDIYLWQTVEDLSGQTSVRAKGNNPFQVEPDPDLNPPQARCSRMPYLVRYERPCWAPLWLWDAFTWPEWFRLRACQWRDEFFPRLGELHFAQGKGWNTEVVAHETSHAALSAARALGISPVGVFSFDGYTSHHFKLTATYYSASPQAQDDFSDEEAYCYIHGDLFEKVYSWMWKVDAPYDARRSEWGL